MGNKRAPTHRINQIAQSLLEMIDFALRRLVRLELLDDDVANSVISRLESNIYFKRDYANLSGGGE